MMSSTLETELQPSTSQIVKILIAEDDALALNALAAILQQANYELLLARNGTEALDLLRQHEIGVILCDQNMPGIDGVSVLRHAAELHNDATRILLTGSGDLQTAMQAINIGQASLFLLKPWDNAFLQQTVAESADKYLLRRENKRLQKLIQDQHLRLTTELELGSRIQEVMLLGHVPSGLKGFDVAASTTPSKGVDGDFYDFFQPVSHAFDVVLGDVMGKGIPAALIGTSVKTQMERFAMPPHQLHLFNHGGILHEVMPKPSEILDRVRQECSPQLVNLEFFVSLFYGRFDARLTTFTYVDCGASKPLHYRALEDDVRLLSGNNLPLGILAKEDYQQFHVSYGTGDVFLIYSDGITEARNSLGQLFGMARLRAILKQYASLCAKELVAIVLKEVMAFVGQKVFEDDLTLVVVKVLDTDLPQVKHEVTANFSNDLSQAKAVRNFVKSVCLQAPGENERLDNLLQLAINEAFCNIVLHGYKQEGGAEIVVKARLGPQGVTFILADQGRVFDPSQVDHPNLVGQKECGFGWYIIREIADEVVYSKKATESDWNHLSIYKRYILDEGQMDLSHNTKSDILIVTLEGDHLDAKETPNFKKRVADLIEQEQVTKAVFDLHRLEFIDSSGLGAFLSILKNLHGKGGDLKLSGMNTTIRTMFELVCMHKIFEIFNSPDEALRSFE